ncbi:MAG: gamma-glutamyltransferase, partial [Deinococcota bacterium]
MSDQQVQSGMQNTVSPTPMLFPEPESMRPTLIGERYMISAGHPLVAQVCAEVLEAGGTAIDAGVAGGLASNVVQVDMCNLGGVAPILVRQAGSSQVHSISGVGHWGSEVTLEAYKSRYGDTMPLGVGIGIVPAAADAWICTLKNFGTMSFAEVAEGARRIAEDGFLLDARTATALEIMGRTFKQWPSSREVYWPQERAPKLGERLRQPALARLLGTLMHVETGETRDVALDNVRSVFYEGDASEHIVSFSQQHGGWLTQDDLAQFACEVKSATSINYHGQQVFTTDTVTQGPVLLQALGILAGFDVAAMGHNSSDYLHVVTEALKLAFSERERCYTDPKWMTEPLDELLSEGYLEHLRNMISMTSVLDDLPTLNHHQSNQLSQQTSTRHDTTYLCVIDSDGNAFSATPSDTLDGGPIIPELGISISPRGVQNRLQAEHPAVIEAGKRPCITPAPALAMTASSDKSANAKLIAFGAPGGDVIVQAMLQAFLNMTHFD